MPTGRGRGRLTHLWWWTALGPREQVEKKAKAKAGKEPVATAKPHHSTTSPR